MSWRGRGWSRLSGSRGGCRSFSAQIFSLKATPIVDFCQPSASDPSQWVVRIDHPEIWIFGDADWSHEALIEDVFIALIEIVTAFGAFAIALPSRLNQVFDKHVIDV